MAKIVTLAMNPAIDKGVSIDRQMLLDLKECVACGRKYNLGEPVVMATGTWDGPPAWVHEEDAELDPETNAHVERRDSQ